jgi:hypothetical protein
MPSRFQPDCIFELENMLMQKRITSVTIPRMRITSFWVSLALIFALPGPRRSFGGEPTAPGLGVAGLYVPALLSPEMKKQL